jgi:hypothetical protein
MGGGGGKGGGQSQQQVTEIPDWLKEPTIRNIGRAETIQKMEYQPYTGIDVAARTPQQEMANQMALDSASAFGMTPSGYANVTPTSGMPTATTVGGVSGYSSYPMFEQAKAEAERLDPRSAGIRRSLYS